MTKRIRNSFLTPLLVEVMPSGKRFKLLYPFTYYWKRYGIRVSVPAGFVTDFASIPQPVSFIISKLGRYDRLGCEEVEAYCHVLFCKNVGLD